MAATHSPFLIVGIALCAVVLIQLCLWAAQSLTILGHNRKQLELSRKLMLQKISSISEQREEFAETVAQRGEDLVHRKKNDVAANGSWDGYRSFTVGRVERETESVTSLYLIPEDRKPVAAFHAGQHLTLRLAVPGKAKPVVRCYSLSAGSASASGIEGPCYKITVKAIVTQLAATETATASTHHGVASTFINQSVCAGDRVEVKAPAGHFFMDEESDLPLVMLAGGIGVTPMISMLERIKASGSQRSAILFYGVRNSQDHAFAKHLDELAESTANLHVITCYSQPLPSDVPQKQFHVNGFVSPELLRQVLPNNHYQFYLCGPQPFMQSLYQGLVDWQVPDSRIHYEAFGPASIGGGNPSQSETLSSHEDPIDPVTFVRSGKTVLWSSEQDSLLALAESSGLFPEAGCRAGSCGSCETSLLSGRVLYDQDRQPDCPAGKCLICVARPDGSVELDL
jgi:ferredoxin-NADP reductase